MKKLELTICDNKRVFVVGDIHGEITKLNDKLKEIGFSKDDDVLISVGDLIDRGEDSLACLSLIEEPWFYSVRGNHEDLMIGSIINKSDGHISYWVKNGGMWYFGMGGDEKFEVDRLAKIADKELPFVLELKYKNRKIVICHADYPSNKYTGEIDDHDIDDIVWSRIRIESIKRGFDVEPIEGADLFVFGHTPIRNPMKVNNCMWIDTGAVFGKDLTIIEL